MQSRKTNECLKPNVKLRAKNNLNSVSSTCLGSMVDACVQYKSTCTLLHENLNKLQGLEKPSTEVCLFVCFFLFVFCIAFFGPFSTTDTYQMYRISFHKFQLIEDCMQCFAHMKKYNCKAQQQCKRVRDNTRQVKFCETLTFQA